MSLRKILLSGIATIALCGVAMAAPAPAPAAPSTPMGTDATGTTGAIGEMNAPAATSGTAISAVADPAKTLKSASVESADGAKVGKVSRVNVNASGKAESLDVKVGAKTVSLLATQATFDPAKKTVVAMLTASDIKKLPKPGEAPSSGMSAPSSAIGSDPAAPAAPTNQ